jgi:Avidin family
MYRFNLRRFAIASLLVVAATAGASADGLPVPSCWGKLRPMVSGLRLFTMDSQGNFTGWYLNYDPSHGAACQNGHYFLTGHASGNHLQFTVQWKNPWQDCGSKTVWQGTVHGTKIVTQWTGYGPQGVRHGSDSFEEQP